MKNKRFIAMLTLVLALGLLAGGCQLLRRPMTEQQRQQDTTPDISKDQQTPPPRTQQVEPQRSADDVAERVAEIAENVQGVESSVVVVISNLALVGITLDRDVNEPDRVKEEVAKRVENNERSIVNAYVSANPDIVKQLEEISAGIKRGEPVSSFFDQITDVLQRMRSENPNRQE